MLNNQNQNQKQNTDNKFIIKATNDLMTKSNHSKSISIGEYVVFDRNIEPYSGCIALIETKANYHTIVMLKQQGDRFIGIYLNDDYKGVEVPISSVVAAAIQLHRYIDFD